jgi:hypothetical protein
MTTFENKCGILADLWLNFRYEDEYKDFLAYNDLGLPLAYAITSDIVSVTDRATAFVEETFANLLTSLGLDEDTGYEDLDTLLSDAV